MTWVFEIPKESYRAKAVHITRLPPKASEFAVVTSPRGATEDAQVKI
jgi:hypothetical protein